MVEVRHTFAAHQLCKFATTQKERLKERLYSFRYYPTDEDSESEKKTAYENGTQGGYKPCSFSALLSLHRNLPVIAYKVHAGH